MTRDPIVDEVRAVREEIAKECGYDLDAIFAALRDMEERSGRAHVTLSARPPVASPDDALQGVAAGSASTRR